jgi:alpha-L-fucosidase 2
MRRLLLPLAILMAGHLSAQQLPMLLWYDKPATYFEESLPLGNGRLGVLVYGNPQEDIIQLNDITLWTGKPIDRQEDAGASKWIPEIRKALFAEDYARADSLQLHVQGHNSSHYQPLGTLHIVSHSAQPVTAYHRELSLDSALACVSYEQGGIHYQREYLVSAPDSLIAIRLTASQPEKLNFELSFTSLLPHNVKATRGQLTMSGHATGDAAETIHFCTIMRVNNIGGEMTATDSSLVLRNATEATLWLVNATSFNGFDRHPVREGAPYIEQANNHAWHTANITFDEVKTRHIADYRQFFARVSLSLSSKSQYHSNLTTDKLLKAYNTGNADADRYLETLYFQYGRYLLISCSRTPGVPANLQGLWNPHLWAPWRGNYTININLEENYWPAFNCNLAEMAMPLDGFLTALAENGHYTSKNYYGITRGWSAGHNSDIWAMANPVGEKNERPEWANWAMGGAWLVEALWDKYLFTRDEAYLRKTAYPLMKGAAEFLLDWLIPNPNNPEELITAPSTSPENEYITDKGYHGMTCYGSTADMAIIRELFINTLQAAALVGDESIVAPLQAALPRLHPYTVGKDGDLNEWYYDWRDYDPRHRHQSHLIGLYPGQHLTTHLSPLTTKLLAACEKTLEQKGDQTTGWSTGWRINLWARLHKGEQAYHIYQKLLSYVSPNPKGEPQYTHGGGTYPNLFDAHPPFQIDGNFGGTAGVCEMLLQSYRSPQTAHHYTIELLPALPSQWDDGEVQGLCARGGYEVSMKWRGGHITETTIKARQSNPVTIIGNGTEKTIRLKAGKAKRIKW